MRVKDLLKTKGSEVFSVSPEATMYDALHIMAQKEIGALIVLEGEKLIGILSERDYARKVILKGKKIKINYMFGYICDAIIHHSVLNENTIFIQKAFTTKILLQNTGSI